MRCHKNSIYYNTKVKKQQNYPFVSYMSKRAFATYYNSTMIIGKSSKALSYRLFLSFNNDNDFKFYLYLYTNWNSSLKKPYFTKLQ